MNLIINKIDINNMKTSVWSVPIKVIHKFQQFLLSRTDRRYVNANMEIYRKRRTKTSKFDWNDSKNEKAVRAWPWRL